MQTKFQTSRGIPSPFGASKTLEGYNFALFSRHARAVSLCLFLPGELTPFVEIPLDPKSNKTGSVWHILVAKLPPDYQYGYRIDGPYDPLKGHFFDNRVIVLDPYAKQVNSPQEWGAPGPKQSLHYHSGQVDPHVPFDWGDEMHPNIPIKELVIYEMHVRGFTNDPSSQTQGRGVYAGIIEKIPYLKALGINAVELMPIHEFNEMGNVNHHPLTGEPLYNYWGYNTVNFFSPMNRYGSIVELKHLVKELHANGIEVILDVVYNHTSEGNGAGPILSFKGIENSVYYMLTPGGEYYNFSGCGNTFNCNHPVARELIRDSLRYWVTEMHIDGFRFDLASIMVRSHDGIPLANPPLIEALTHDPILANTKLIAEAWDAGGLYQVGSFPGKGRWAEWNGKYRDCIRSFLKGTDGVVGEFATRLSGSEDLYGKGKFPGQSINFVTAHDGFTLADLVSYNEKHNLDNGEENRDGDNHNESWNCGVEGETDDPEILALRERQMKNHHLALMLSQGVPMILMGDEYGHTKLGNNNTWGHDSRLNWFQWDTLEKRSAFFRFYQKVIAFRKNHPLLTRSQFLKDHDITWHGMEPGKPDWGEKSRFIACTLPDPLNRYSLYVAFNAFFHEMTIHLPKSEKPWHLQIYTANPSPDDIVEECEKGPRIEKTFLLAPHSALVLKSESDRSLVTDML
ncbi:MAG: Glycogen operon protein GlgX [Chlamydiales bacterium]|nr:Glycogen operon protein GlgX [Chlamydiales bacterium]